MTLHGTSKRKENCTELAEKPVARIMFEIGQIDHLLGLYADLLEQVQRRRPGLVEITAVASVLHSFYSGLEKVFGSIAKGIDTSVPDGARWHGDLLTQMAQPTPNREAVLSPDTASQLADYLAFRHFYRHSYSFTLAWDEMEELARSLLEVWSQAKDELQHFIDGLPN
jgi:hypothetical protein